MTPSMQSSNRPGDPAYSPYSAQEADSGRDTDLSPETRVSPESPNGTPDPAGPGSGVPPKGSSVARRVALTGLLASLALIFSYVEVLFPFNAGVPGIKLGLANLVPLIVLYRLDARYAAGVNLIRVVLAGLLFTGAFATLYSLAGCVCSFLVMWFCKKTGFFSIVGVSMAGGVFHNLGQLGVAILAVSNLQLIHYMPVLILSGLTAGIIVGIGAYILLDRLPTRLFKD